MINETYANAFCIEDISNIENYEQALNDSTQTWDCHHRREIDENKSRARLIAEKLYYHRPASELIFLTRSQHRSLHNIGNKYGIGNKGSRGRVVSEETRRKMSLSMLGKNKGKCRSEEARKKMSLKRIGVSPWNKGKHHSEETKKKCSAAVKGTHWWNNGIVSKQKRECPGEGWVRGILKRK